MTIHDSSTTVVIHSGPQVSAVMLASPDNLWFWTVLHMHMSVSVLVLEDSILCALHLKLFL